MQKYLLFITLFSCGAVATLQAQSLRNTNAPIEGAAIQVDIGGDGYYDGGCDDCYGQGYYDDGVVWVGPGWYYGTYFYDEPAYWGYRRNYYWRGRGYGWRGHRGYRGGYHRGYHGGHRRGHHGGHHGGHRGGGRHR